MTSVQIEGWVHFLNGETTICGKLIPKGSIAGRDMFPTCGACLEIAKESCS